MKEGFGLVRMNEVSRARHPFACSLLVMGTRLMGREACTGRCIAAGHQRLIPTSSSSFCDIDKGVLLMAKKNIPEPLKSYFCIFLILTQTAESPLFLRLLGFLWSHPSQPEGVPAGGTLASPSTSDIPQTCFWTPGCSSPILQLKRDSRFWLQVGDLRGSQEHQPGQSRENVMLLVHPDGVVIFKGSSSAHASWKTWI